MSGRGGRSYDFAVDTLWQLVGDQIPDDHARQYHSQDYLREAMTAPDAPTLMVDLGCGDGRSAKFAKQYKPNISWVGVDIMSSTYAKKVANEQVLLYDGVNLPFADDSIPLIYSSQVMEHVRHPEPLLREVRRVLQPGGVFIGSTSQLEPYHAGSLWNYTIYGFKVLVEDAGLALEQVRPGIDGISLVQRQWFGRRPEHGAWFKLSPLNRQIDQEDAARRREAKYTNFRKLQYCGHFSFRARKPGGEPPPPVRSSVGAPAAEPAPPPVAPMQPLGATPPPPPPPPPPLPLRQRLRRKAGRVVRRARRAMPGGKTTR
ncbi:MAG TPA: class I SAM-dependent methyltransferase [Actinoplanes sp.]|jgi:SAM-dependent methyltransferase|nr:class I SAM-dependent methyltransferase [Actinoplanes sp.]